MNPKESEILTKTFQLCAEANKIAQGFPEDGYVTYEIRSTVKLIPPRITRGYERKRSDGDTEDLYEAYSYLLDLESQIILARKLGYIDYEISKRLKVKLEDLVIMLRSFIGSLSAENVSRENKDRRHR